MRCGDWRVARWVGISWNGEIMGFKVVFETVEWWWSSNGKSYLVRYLSNLVKHPWMTLPHPDWVGLSIWTMNYNRPPITFSLPITEVLCCGHLQQGLVIASMHDYLGWRNTAVDDTHEDWSDDDDDDNDPQPWSLISHVHDRINHTSLCTTSHSSRTSQSRTLHTPLQSHHTDCLQWWKSWPWPLRQMLGLDSYGLSLETCGCGLCPRL